MKTAGTVSGMYRSPTAHVDLEFMRKNEYTEYMKLATDLKALQELLEEVGFLSVDDELGDY